MRTTGVRRCAVEGEDAVAKAGRAGPLPSSSAVSSSPAGTDTCSPTSSASGRPPTSSTISPITISSVRAVVGACARLAERGHHRGPQLDRLAQRPRSLEVGGDRVGLDQTPVAPAGLVVDHHLDCHPVGVGQRRHPLVDGQGGVEHAVVDELEGDGAHQALGEAADAERRAGLGRAPVDVLPDRDEHVVATGNAHRGDGRGRWDVDTGCVPLDRPRCDRLAQHGLDLGGEVVGGPPGRRFGDRGRWRRLLVGVGCRGSGGRLLGGGRLYRSRVDRSRVDRSRFRPASPSPHAAATSSAAQASPAVMVDRESLMIPNVRIGGSRVIGVGQQFAVRGLCGWPR